MVQVTYLQAFCSFQTAEEVQNRKIGLLTEQNIYFVQYVALSRAETL